MRRVLAGDVLAAAAVLRAVPSGRRARRMAALMRAAGMAQRHMRACGRAHPRFGTGSLMSAAGGVGAGSVPGFSDADDLACLIAVLEALAGRAAQQPVPPAAAPA